LKKIPFLDNKFPKIDILMAYVRIFWGLNFLKFPFWDTLMAYISESCDFLKKGQIDGIKISKKGKF